MSRFQNDPMPGVPRSAFATGAVLAAIMAAAFAVSLGEMRSWGVSAVGLAEGQWWSLITHLFAHGDLVHLTFNALLTLVLSGPIIVRLSRAPENKWRFVLFFLLAGIAGALAYVSLNPLMDLPAIGASGAVFAMIGLMARLPMRGPIVPGQRVAPLTGELIGKNLFLMAVLTLPSLLVPRFMGIAWEAHLAGFLFGFFAGPLFVARR